MLGFIMNYYNCIMIVAKEEPLGFFNLLKMNIKTTTTSTTTTTSATTTASTTTTSLLGIELAEGKMY